MTSQTKITAPAIIHRLVETFEENLDEYRSSKNETELRREFLDKFFAALGWDVSNEKGYDEAHKEVIHEYSVEMAGQGKKADYAFRTGGDKFDFLVEAKKPSVKVENSQDAAFQLRRYGWSAKLPINILTDFEHLAVYDCRAKPSYNDKASIGRIMLVHYKEYVERWDEIVEIFSPEAVRKGSFAKYTEGMKGRKGTADVDDAFLQEIERWRELLAKSIALRNEDIDIAGLNYAVQMTIDRIVFLRISEERGIEPENQLQDITNSDGVYEELCKLFKRADTKYNSGLFHFKKEKELVSRPDDLTLSLAIDDKVLKDIISNLYYPKSPYAFLYIPSDILGQVYERFLGKVIRLTAGHQAKVEEKPEVRKAGGVYYTPTYIVDYIVKNTVGKLVENKSPKDVSSLKVVDPACGSGTFLLGAYQFLLDWHLNWFVANEPEKWEKNKDITPLSSPHFEVQKWGDRGGWCLTTAKKKEILLNNIHGVDIDAQAVEVTKLSLLLKVLENASGQLGLGMERVLPDLGNNIKCGNSLIGFDYFEGQLFPDEEERASVNPFDWRNEFKDVFARGGFDVVIGNPPYHSVKLMVQSEKDYFYSGYKVADKRFNLFSLFIERSANVIIKKGGKFGFIIPSAILANSQYFLLRNFVLQNFSITEIVDFKGGVFADANIETLILLMSVVDSSDGAENNKIRVIYDIDNFEEKKYSERIQIQGDYYKSDENTFYIGRTIQTGNDFTLPLGEMVEIRNGINTGNIAKQIVLREKLNKSCKPLIDGKDVQRYEPPIWREQYIYYDIDFVEKLRKEWAKKGLDWTARIIKKENYFEQEKLIVQRIRNLSLDKRLVFTYDNENYYTSINIGVVTSKGNSPYNLKYFLGILNSTYMNNYFKRHFHSIQIKNQFLERLPVHTIDFSNPAEKAQHDKMVSLIEQMLASHKILSMAQTPQEKQRLERQIEVTDKAIDSLVYALYGLSDEEIRIVEEK
jgi:type I restriction-modification system DNA methylase subunit